MVARPTVVGGDRTLVVPVVVTAVRVREAYAVLNSVVYATLVVMIDATTTLVRTHAAIHDARRAVLAAGRLALPVPAARCNYSIVTDFVISTHVRGTIVAVVAVGIVSTTIGHVDMKADCLFTLVKGACIAVITVPTHAAAPIIATLFPAALGLAIYANPSGAGTPAVLAVLSTRHSPQAQAVASGGHRPIAHRFARRTNPGLTQGVFARLLSRTIGGLESQPVLRTVAHSVVVHAEVGSGGTSKVQAQAVHAHLARSTAVHLVDNAAPLLVARCGNILLAEQCAGGTDLGEAFSTGTVVFGGAVVGRELHTIRGAQAVAEIVHAEFLQGHAKGVDARTVEAVLPFGRTILLELHRFSIFGADLVHLAIAPDGVGCAGVVVASGVLAVLPLAAGFCSGPPAAVIQAGDHGILVAVGLTHGTLGGKAEALVAILVVFAVLIGEALDAQARHLVADKPVSLAIQIGVTRNGHMTGVVRSAELPFPAIFVTDAGDALSDVRCTDQLPRTVLGRLARRVRALARVIAGQPRVTGSAGSFAAVGAALLAGTIRRANLALGVLGVAFGDFRLPVHIDGRFSTAPAGGHQEGGEKKWGCSLHHALLRWFCSFPMGQ